MVSVRGFAEAAQHAVGVWGGFQCGEDVYPDNHAQRTIESLQLPFFLASLVFWLFLASMVFGIALSLFHVCMHVVTAVLNVV